MKQFQVEFNQKKEYYSSKVYQNKMPFLYQFKMPLTLLRKTRTAGYFWPKLAPGITWAQFRNYTFRYHHP